MYGFNGCQRCNICLEILRPGLWRRGHVFVFVPIICQTEVCSSSKTSSATLSPAELERAVARDSSKEI